MEASLSADEHTKVDEQVVEQLNKVADTMAAMLSTLLESQEGQSRDLDHFREDLKEVHGAIRRIAKVLHEGNGEKPLIARVATIENQIIELRRDLERLEVSDSDRLSQEKEAERVGRKGKYTVTVALISAVAAIGAAVLSFLGN